MSEDGSCRPSGSPGLVFRGAAAALVCSISGHRNLPAALPAAPAPHLTGAGTVGYSKHTVWPRPAALATCFSHNPTGKGEMCLLLDGLSQGSHHHGNPAIHQYYQN